MAVCVRRCILNLSVTRSHLSSSFFIFLSFFLCAVAAILSFLAPSLDAFLSNYSSSEQLPLLGRRDHSRKCSTSFGLLCLAFCHCEEEEKSNKWEQRMSLWTSKRFQCFSFSAHSTFKRSKVALRLPLSDADCPRRHPRRRHSPFAIWNFCLYGIHSDVLFAKTHFTCCSRQSFAPFNFFTRKTVKCIALVLRRSGKSRFAL